MHLSGIHLKPYELKEVDDQRVVVAFAAICDHDRTPEYEAELTGLVETREIIACDLSATEQIGTDWLQWLARLTVQAERVGKTLALAGANDSVLSTADAVGLRGTLVFADDLESVLTP